MPDKPTITDQAVETFRAAALAEARLTTTDDGIRAGLAAAAPHITTQADALLRRAHRAMRAIDAQSSLTLDLAAYLAGRPGSAATTRTERDLGAAAQLVLDGRLDMAVQTRAAFLAASEGWSPDDERIEDLPLGLAGAARDHVEATEEFLGITRFEGEHATIGRLATAMGEAAKAVREALEVAPTDDGIAWIELDASHEQPRLILTGDLEALRALAGRFPAHAAERADRG